jgi:adenylyltransferase/sulfurtransferase
MHDDDLLRYSRQILLADVGTEGQQRLLDARVLIIGAGGLGSPVGMYLAAAGVGDITISDFDTVDLTNLQRQIAHTTQDIGCAKADSLAKRMRALNPHVAIHPVNRSLEGEALIEAARRADLVLDCSDNFTTRFTVNAACVKTGTPLVSGAAIRMEGQVATFLNNGEGPCYRCLYREEGDDEDTCSTTGVLAPVVGVIGALQATEALKVLMGLPSLDGQLLIADLKSMDWRKMKLRKDPVCKVCGTPPAQG